MVYEAPKRIGAINAETFLEDLLRLVNAGDEVIIDFSKTAYVSSACLRSIIMASKIARHKSLSPIKCINVSSFVQKVFDTACLEAFVKIE